jgi:hypothetical protein
MGGQVTPVGALARRSSAYCSTGRAFRAERGFLYREGGGGALSNLSRLASNSPRVGTGILRPFGVYCSSGSCFMRRE